MTPSPFAPSKWDLIDALRREDPSLSETMAAYRIIDDLQDRIQSLNAQLNQQSFLKVLWMRVALSLLGFMVIAAVGMWVRR